MPNYTNENIDRLFEAIAKMQSAEECRAFFEDLCTIREMQDMAQRFRTAELLSEGENYQSVSEKVGVSSATISRVNHCLHYGSGGYGKAIEKIKEERK